MRTHPETFLPLKNVVVLKINFMSYVRERTKKDI